MSLDFSLLPSQNYEYRVLIDGCEVPYLKAFRPLNGRRTIILDDRFGFDCPEDELYAYLNFLADAMAVAAGYSSFGKNARPRRNPFEYVETTNPPSITDEQR